VLQALFDLNLFVGKWQDEDGEVQCLVKDWGKDKLLIPKLHSFIKHLSFKKCNVAKLGMVIGAYYVNPNNAHVKNEKSYIFTRHDMVIDLVEKVEKKKKYVQFVAIWHLLKGHPMIDFE